MHKFNPLPLTEEAILAAALRRAKEQYPDWSNIPVVCIIGFFNDAKGSPGCMGIWQLWEIINRNKLPTHSKGIQMGGAVRDFITHHAAGVIPEPTQQTTKHLEITLQLGEEHVA